ncbi:unnamed protein product [Mytilus coruscus]|uniref:Uncharacterized protein n=1 Tax=Mytilus coruscus TaxID=42192 RepID=A0A6J8BEP3_MYTCO|nr:unnamed protein product [Mytilus coruscus]
MVSSNLDTCIEKMESIIKMWKIRSLSVIGKIVIVKSHTISKLIYVISSTHVPKSYVIKIQRDINSFLWNGGTPKVKSEVIQKSPSEGGLKAPNFELQLLSFRIMWDEKTKEQGQGVESRFAEMTDHEIDILIKETENKNTMKATKWAVNVYEDWKNSKIGSGFIIPDLKDLSVQDINSILGIFVVKVRKKNGEKYPAKTLYLLVTGLLRGMRSQGVSNRNFLNESDDRFLRFRQIIDSQMKKKTIIGKC